MAMVAVAGTMIADGMVIVAGAATAAGMAIAAGAATAVGTATAAIGTDHIGAMPIMAGATAAGLSGAGITACASAAEPWGTLGAAATVAAHFSLEFNCLSEKSGPVVPECQCPHVQCSVQIGNVSDPS